MTSVGPDVLIEQDGLTRATKKARISPDAPSEFPAHPFLGAHSGVVLKERAQKRAHPLQEEPHETVLEKRTRLGSEIAPKRPALVELPSQNLHSPPRSPAGRVVDLTGLLAASREQIDAALQAPWPQATSQGAADDNSDASPSFSPRTPQPKAKAASPYDDKEWQRFFGLLTLNARDSPAASPSRSLTGALRQAQQQQRQQQQQQLPGSSPQVRGSFFLGEFGRCSQTLRSRSLTGAAGGSGGV